MVVLPRLVGVYTKQKLTMENMTDIMVLIGSAMPDHLIIPEMQKAVNAWAANPCPETKARGAMFCMLIMAGEAGRSHSTGPQGLVQEIRRDQEMLKVINPDRPLQ